MLQTLKQLLGFGPKTDYSALVKQGAIILDVRSKGEYRCSWHGDGNAQHQLREPAAGGVESVTERGG